MFPYWGEISWEIKRVNFVKLELLIQRGHLNKTGCLYLHHFQANLQIHLCFLKSQNISCLFPWHANLWQIVSWRAETIPEKVKISRPINGVKKSEMNLFWCISITSNVKTCKKFNERAQTANFSVLSRLRQELCAENPQNMENKGN